MTQAEELAGMLVGAGYPREQIRAAILKDHPGADADALIDAAQARKDGLDASLALGSELDAQAAVDAEHDTDKTMHRRPNGED